MCYPQCLGLFVFFVRILGVSSSNSNMICYVKVVCCVIFRLSCIMSPHWVLSVTMWLFVLFVYFELIYTNSYILPTVFIPFRIYKLATKRYVPIRIQFCLYNLGESSSNSNTIGYITISLVCNKSFIPITIIQWFLFFTIHQIP